MGRAGPLSLALSLRERARERGGESGLLPLTEGTTTGNAMAGNRSIDDAARQRTALRWPRPLGSGFAGDVADADGGEA
jgi:hypothetical protein